VWPNWSIGISKRGLFVSDNGNAQAWRVANIETVGDQCPKVVMHSDNFQALGFTLAPSMGKAISEGNELAARFWSGMQRV
jgi:hypothetical protein